jgi:hypothetical protein
MAILWRRWDGSATKFGDTVVLGFFLVQFLDGAFTYLGMRIWGVGVEANPLISLAVTAAGLAAGLTAVKLVAVMFGIALHLYRVHGVVALLVAVYLAVAILPWTALFLTQ